MNRSAVNFSDSDNRSGNLMADYGAMGLKGGAAVAAVVGNEVAGSHLPSPVQKVSGLTLALEQEQMPRDDIPVIPLEELMLLDTLGCGRVSTIYRAVWRQPLQTHVDSSGRDDTSVAMVALKVATTEPGMGDISSIKELQQEADIASMLDHNNICSLIGVASDYE